MGERSEFVLAIDCGSTNFKAGLFDKDLGRIGHDSFALDYIEPEDGAFELDGEKIWEDLVSLIGRICRNAGISPCDIEKISLTSQANSFILLGSDGRLVSRIFSWRDERSRKEAEELQDKIGAEFHRHCSMPEPVEGLAIAQLKRIKKQNPELLKESNMFCFLPQFLAFRLAGVNVIDGNLAAMSGLYSLEENRWWGEALESCGLVERQLPKVVDIGGQVEAENVTDGLSFSKSLKIVYAGNDQTAGAYANQCQDGSVVVTLGTALVVYRYTGLTAGPYSIGGCWGPWPGGGYYDLSFTNFCCSALDWAREQVLPGCDINTFTDLAKSACNIKDREILFYPERMGKKNAWQGEGEIREKTVAILEGITFSLCDLVFDKLEIQRPLSLVRVGGGGAKNKLWRQLIADILDCSVVRTEKDSVLGAAMMALGKRSEDKKDRRSELKAKRSSVEHYNKLFKKWLSHR